MKRNFLLGFCAFGIISGITSAAYNSSILNASAAVAKKQTSYKTANLSYAGAGTEKRNYTQTRARRFMSYSARSLSFNKSSLVTKITSAACSSTSPL